MNEETANRTLNLNAMPEFYQSDDKDPVGRRILAAAEAQFRDHGIRKSSMEDIAQRAGVSRITVYRRFENKERLIEHVFRHEAGLLMQQHLRAVSSIDTVEERLAEGFTIALISINRHPLLKSLVLSEPSRIAALLEASADNPMFAFLLAALRREQMSGAVAADVDVEVIAELFARITVSFFIAPVSKTNFDDETEIRAFARRYLVPMLGFGRS